MKVQELVARCSEAAESAEPRPLTPITPTTTFSLADFDSWALAEFVKNEPAAQAAPAAEVACRNVRRSAGAVMAGSRWAGKGGLQDLDQWSGRAAGAWEPIPRLHPRLL